MAGRSSRTHGVKVRFDPDEAITHLRERDLKLASLIDRVGEFRLKLNPTPSPFEALSESIIYQQ
ncbi:MAG TPA: cysteine methyltransferase, partial [Candidatus Eisenbacteria bacterium]|nr:cysteine methyltransferase [Candidatus Eisenbacteria bacterium]